MELLKDNVKRIWFQDDKIHLQTNDGREASMPLRWFPALEKATAAEREDFRQSIDGIHWERLDEDLSYAGFFTFNKDEITAKRTEVQKLLARFPYFNLEQLSHITGISSTLIRHYACGTKKPSAQRTEQIKEALRSIGKELIAV